MTKLINLGQIPSDCKTCEEKEREGRERGEREERERIERGERGDKVGMKCGDSHAHSSHEEGREGVVI